MKYIYLAIILLLVFNAAAQPALTVIKAASKTVSIRDDDFFEKDAWTLSPKTRPDVYTADRTRKTKWVTFYTDIDSMRVKVAPGSRFDFVILLNSKDSCFTRIVSAIPPKTTLPQATHDTIPFTLTEFSAISIKTVVNNTDTLNLHFDAGSFDFHITRDAIKQKLHGAKVTKLQMGSLTFNNTDAIATTLSARNMDGRFGWNLFEGQVVEIDYDKSLFIVHSAMPRLPKGFVRSKLGFTRSYPNLTGSFEIANQTYTGSFILDTGSEQAIILDSAWMSRQNFPKDLKLIKSSVLHDPRGVKYETKIVLAPVFKLNGTKLLKIPVLLLNNQNPMRTVINYLGNGLLKRFNVVMDFEHDDIYLKPNKLLQTEYNQKS